IVCTDIPDKGLIQLGRIEQFVRFSRGKLTDRKLRLLREANLLHHLGLANTSKYAPLKQPNTPDDVVAFSLASSEVTDVGLMELSCFKNLRKIAIESSGVTPQGVEKLKLIAKLDKLSITQSLLE